VRRGSEELVQLILDKDIGGGAVTPNDEGDTPLSLAAQLQRFDLVTLLMNQLQEPFVGSPGAPLRLSTHLVDQSSGSSMSWIGSERLESDDEVVDNISVVSGGDCSRQETDGDEVEVAHQQCCEPFAEAAKCSILDSPISETSPNLCPSEGHRSMSNSPFGAGGRHRSLSLLSESDEYAFVSSGRRYEADDCVCQGSTDSDLFEADTTRRSRVGDDPCCSLPVAVSPHAEDRLLFMQQPILSEGATSEENTVDPESSPDFGLFVELEFEDDSSSQQVHSSTKSISKSVVVTKDVPRKEVATRRLVPRFVRKAAGRIVRFVLPPTDTKT
jgi:hypothetical protein